MDTNSTNPITQNPGRPTYAERLQKLAVDDAYWNGYYKGAWTGLVKGMLVTGLFILTTSLIAHAVKVTTKEEETND